MPEKLAYSIDEAAAALSLSRNSVKELVYQQRLKSVRVGRRVLIPRWAIDQFLNVGDEPSGSAGGWDRLLESR